MSKKLKKCPFCGCNDPKYVIRRSNYNPDNMHAIKCYKCGVMTEYKNSAHEAVMAWNRRAKK